MPVIMTQKRNQIKLKELKEQISKELNFLKNVFTISGLYSQMKGEVEENVDYEMVLDKQPQSDGKEMPKRARSIVELEEKLRKIKSQNNFNLKNKLARKSLNSKLNKKIKKTERLNTRVKGKPVDKPLEMVEAKVEHPDEKPKVNLPKPIFNSDGKLVFSKFDFTNAGHNAKQKGTKDPKKLLENLKQQEQRFQKLEEYHQEDKVKKIKEKMAWKNILDKAEGQKIKDDPILLKKSIKKIEQQKKRSENQWDNRVKTVQQNKEDRQKKRKENIAKKNKEKKSKIVKAAVKRGRVVI